MACMLVQRNVYSLKKLLFQQAICIEMYIFQYFMAMSLHGHCVGFMVVEANPVLLVQSLVNPKS